MTTAPSIPSPPVQRRSRRTLARILAATERQLEREPFEAITVRTIVKRARTSVGSFYARFPDKQALLPALYARYEVSLATHLDELERSLAAPGQTLATSAALIAKHFVRIYGERPHLMLALAEYAGANPGGLAGQRPGRPPGHRRAQHEFLHRALHSGAREGRRATSERDVATALFVVDAACRERLLRPTTAHNRALDLTDGELADALARMLVAFLTSKAARPTSSRRKR